MAGEDRRYVEWIRSQQCRMCGCPPRVTAHHRTGAGAGLRAHDRDTIPLCGPWKNNCHQKFHLIQGPFDGWKKDDLRTWQGEAIRELQSIYLSSHDAGAEDDVM